MQFSINDKVIHPNHGAGKITGIQQRGPAQEVRSYYVIEIPGQRLTVYVPSNRMEQIGVRQAMPLDNLPGVLDMLQSHADQLPTDHQQRQVGIGEKLDTGRVLQLAEVVRDLTWHRRETHLTKKDTELLKRGRDLLAAELALAADTEVAEANRVIDAALAIGMENTAEQE